MRGDQLAREWRLIRAIEANPWRLTVGEIAKREETGTRAVYCGLDAIQRVGLILYIERAEKESRRAFIETFKFKIPSSLPLYPVIPPNTIFRKPRTGAWTTIA